MRGAGSPEDKSKAEEVMIIQEVDKHIKEIERLYIYASTESATHNKWRGLSSLFKQTTTLITQDSEELKKAVKSTFDNLEKIFAEFKSLNEPQQMKDAMAKLMNASTKLHHLFTTPRLGKLDPNSPREPKYPISAAAIKNAKWIEDTATAYFNNIQIYKPPTYIPER